MPDDSLVPFGVERVGVDDRGAEDIGGVELDGTSYT